MEFYIIIYVILAIIAVIGCNKIKNQSILTAISFILIVCLQGLRWRTGTDWLPYENCFELSNKYQVPYVEFGYYIFNKIIRCFTNSYTIFLLIECCIVAICQCVFSKQFLVKNISATLLYFFATCIFPIRFTLATAIFLLSYKYIIERKLLKFLLVYIIASSIHQIIVLTLPLYFLCTRDFRAKTLLIIYLGCCGVGLMTELVFKNITDAVTLVFAYLPTFSQEKALAYLQESGESASFMSNFVSYINGLLFIGLFLYFKKKFKFNSVRYNVLLNIYVLGLSFSRLFLNTIPYLSRINLCTSGGFIIILLLILQKTNSSYRWLLTSILFLYFIVSYTAQINAYQDLYIHYYSIFSYVHRVHVY